MPYVPITINRKILTIMGVAFPDPETLESIADAIGSNMFEGFQPTRRGIEIIRDYCLGKLMFAQLMTLAREKSHAETYELYMAGTINGDVEVLEKRIFECLSEAVG